MAKTTIKSTSTTLDGLVHTLDDRDRVAAQLASDTALNLKINVTKLGDGISETQLTADDCGIVTLGVVGTQTAVSKGYNVDLPAPEAGLYYKFVFVGPSIASNANAAITITSNSDNASTAADLIVGSVLGNGDDDGANVTAVADVITFVHAKATAGDFAEIFCDGTNWILNARYDADGAITLT
tara:strand:- start:2314 stop:2862 length:549 start_codon:yes stop_codon:yes gene_type:complete